MQYPSKFMTSVLAAVGVSLFGIFCFTVQAFPEGSVSLEGPWDIRIETHFGEGEDEGEPSLCAK